MLKKFLLAVVILVVVLLVVVALRPGEYRVTRSATMAVPPARVFGLVNDLRQWNAWSPWAKLDPAARNTFEGPESGKGAIFRWAGNSQVGEGAMTITESIPPERLQMRLDFLKPMPGTSLTDFNFQPEGQGTKVTWTMTGTNGFAGKAICLFMDMDRMVGGQFEQGLASLRSLAEGATPPPLPAAGTTTTSPPPPSAGAPAPGASAAPAAKPETPPESSRKEGGR